MVEQMPNNPCPTCGGAIAIEDINIAQGVGLCRACQRVVKLSEIVDRPDPALTSGPAPSGCKLERTPDGALVIEASTRSWSMAIGLLAVCLFWNGIVSVFLSQAIGGLWANLIGPLPAWYPTAGSSGQAPTMTSNGVTGPMTLGTSIFVALFMVPFVVVGLLIIAGMLTAIAGRVRVSLSGSSGVAATGIGPFWWRKRFDPSTVQRVEVQTQRGSNDSAARHSIVIVANRTVRFGSMLNEERRQWMLATLWKLLIAKQPVEPG